MALCRLSILWSTDVNVENEIFFEVKGRIDEDKNTLYFNSGYLEQNPYPKVTVVINKKEKWAEITVIEPLIKNKSSSIELKVFGEIDDDKKTLLFFSNTPQKPMVSITIKRDKTKIKS